MKTDTVLKKGIQGALFWGSVWGLLEATVGHMLHLLRVPGLAGFVMWPVGLFLMFRAFRDSGKPGAAFLASAVAAGLKAADLLMPGTDPSAVLRPASAILCEGLAVSAFLTFMILKIPSRLLSAEKDIWTGRQN